MVQVQLKLRPTKAQERTLERWLWHLTSVWNWALLKMEADRDAGIGRSYYDFTRLVRGHSQRIGVPQVAIFGTIKTAIQSRRNFIEGRSRRPRLKGARRKLSSIAFCKWEDQTFARIHGNRVSIPLMGRVRFHKQDIPEGHVGQARIVRRASGWYLCLFVHAESQPAPRVHDCEVGIDPGFSSLLTLSSGEKIEHPNELASDEQRLAQAQRGHRRQLTARIQERIRNRRKNRNHHLSRRLVSENQLIAFSADNHRTIAKAFGKSVSSAGHSQLRSMLAYKSRAGGREYIEVPNRNSTRTCSACGALSGPTGWRGLSVRQWVCTTCGVEHDRDCNAAVNTLIAGRGMRHESGREATSGIAL